MPQFFRNFCMVAALSEVVCILGAAAHAQQTAAPAQPGSGAPALSAASAALPLQPAHLRAFAVFMQEVGLDDLAARKEAITGESQFRIDWRSVNRVSIGLNDEDWAVAWAILLDGNQKMADWGDQMQDAMGWKDGRYQAAPSGHATERLATLEVLTDQGAPIVNQTIYLLRQNLGDRAFNKLDAFVCQRESGHKTVEPASIHRGPMETETAKASVQADVQAPK